MVWIPRQTGGEMNEIEMQELQNRVVESIQDFFDAYDWDAKFIQHFGEWGVLFPSVELFVSHSP